MNTNEQANTASVDMTAELVERLRVAMTIPVTILTVPTMQEIIDTLAAQEAELAQVREHCRQLTGDKFSDRNHAALKSRARAA